MITEPLSFLFGFLQYEFMVRAMAAGIVTGVIAPVIGVFLVARKYSFLADTLSHVSLAGVAVAFLAGLHPIAAALCLSAAAGLCVEHLRARRHHLSEPILALLLFGAMAVAAVLLSITRGLNINISSVLFGSITTVSGQDILIISILGAVVVAGVAAVYRQLSAVAFDEELAIAGGVPVRALNAAFVLLAAVTVSLSMRIVGILLIGALMVIPVLAAMQCARSFRQTLMYSVAFSLFSVCTGLTLSYHAGVSSGGSITLVAVAVFGAAACCKALKG